MREQWSESLLSKKRIRAVILIVIGAAIAWFGTSRIERISETFDRACAEVDETFGCEYGISPDLELLTLVVFFCAVALPAAIAAFLAYIDRSEKREAWMRRDPTGFAAHDAVAQRELNQER